MKKALCLLTGTAVAVAALFPLACHQVIKPAATLTNAVNTQLSNTQLSNTEHFNSQPTTKYLKPKTPLEKLAGQLEQGPNHEQAAKELLKLGTREAIRVLVFNALSSLKVSLETGLPHGGHPYELIMDGIANSQNRDVATWIFEIFKELPLEPGLGGTTPYGTIKKFTDIIGYLATPELLMAVAAEAQIPTNNISAHPTVPAGGKFLNESEIRHDIYLDILRAANHPDTIQTLEVITLLTDWKIHGENSASVAAGVALGQQGTYEAVKFLLEQYSGGTDSPAIIEGLSSITTDNALPFLEQVADGNRAEMRDTATRVAAITILGNIDGSVAPQVLLPLLDSPDRTIVVAADEALQTISKRVYNSVEQPAWTDKVQ